MHDNLHVYVSQICLDDLLACGGTIAVDNALHFGTPYAGKPDEPLAMFNEWILTRHDICHVSKYIIVLYKIMLTLYIVF